MFADVNLGGNGYIEFEKQQSIKVALAMDGTVIDGYKIKVEYESPSPSSPSLSHYRRLHPTKKPAPPERVVSQPMWVADTKVFAIGISC